MQIHSDRRLLAGLTPRQFLSRHWQKKPLLIRQAIPGFLGPLTREMFLRLATDPALETRLVERQGRQWTLDHGPFSRRALAALPQRNWTLLIQGLNHVRAEADDLLRRFSFIPYARFDDVMASFAVTGGGVGPHLDSYDVFLLQGAGKRRWRIGIPESTEMQEGLPLKILRRFRPQQEWVLEPGDMLYLPPGYAHEGVAMTDCITYSIGFRAPSHQELCARFLDYLHDTLAVEGRITDARLKPAARPAALPPAMLAQAQRALSGIRWNRAAIADFLGRDLTEPKPHIVFSPPRKPLNAAAFAAALRSAGIVLDARSLMLYHGSRVYLNGETIAGSAATKNDLALLKALADRRRLVTGASLSAPLRALLRAWYLCGFVHIVSGRI